MSIDLTGKPIAITGASSGIGAATAAACARAGMPVVLGARRADRLAEVVRAITAEGGRAVAVAMDVCRESDSQRLIEASLDAFGSVYAVFANAGYGLETPLLEMTESELRGIFECNYFGSLHLARAAERAMHDNPGPHRGHILFCSSCLARLTLPFYSAYSATKAAQHHAGRALNLELAPLGIHVSTVHPVSARTEFFDQARVRSGGGPLAHQSPELFVQPAERVARAVVRCLRRPRPEVWTSLLARLGMAVCTAFPGIEDRFLRRMVAAKPPTDRREPARPAMTASGGAFTRSREADPSPGPRPAASGAGRSSAPAGARGGS